MPDSKHIPGPWRLDTVGPPTIWARTKKGDMKIADVRGWGHLIGGGALALPEHEAAQIQDTNGRLMAAAPDHALVCRLLISGTARWEPNTSEFCLNGLRYFTELDEFGIPVIHKVLRAAIAKAEGRS